MVAAIFKKEIIRSVPEKGIECLKMMMTDVLPMG